MIYLSRCLSCMSRAAWLPVKRSSAPMKPRDPARASDGCNEAIAGAVAFSRRGDPDVGEFEDAVILKAFGEVPDDLLGITRPGQGRT
jgi:hypothetical protein